MILAVLFHDIGKGEGGGHAEKGAAMIPTIARRMGLSREDSERLEFPGAPASALCPYLTAPRSA